MILPSHLRRIHLPTTFCLLAFFGPNRRHMSPAEARKSEALAGVERPVVASGSGTSEDVTEDSESVSSVTTVAAAVAAICASASF